MEEKIAQAARSPLFRGIPPAALEGLLPRLEPVRLSRRKGETLLSPGQAAPGVGLVLSGSLLILREDFWGNRSLLTQVGPGGLFAEAFACAGAPLTVRVEAAAEVSALFFPPARLFAPPPGGEALPGNLTALLAEKNLMLNRKIDHISQRTIRAKVLAYLSYQAAQAGASTFTIPFRRQELADYLAVDRSALSAELSRMRREGILDFDRSRFTLRRLPPE